MSEILTDLNEHILTVTLNRPDIHNAISHTAMVEAIVDVCQRANKDKLIRVMVLTGAGKSFCAGGNVKDMRDQSDMFGGSKADIERAYQQGIQRIPLALWKVKVPIICAVNGAAVGAGCDLAMMSDIRIASTRARFAESFVKLGIIPGDGGAWFLPRIVGAARAAQMTLTGEMVDATTALEWGMVSRVVEPEELMLAAHELAEGIAANPPLAVQQAKAFLRMSADVSLESMLSLCANKQAQLHHSHDHLEAVNAFLEKRRGHYTGD